MVLKMADQNPKKRRGIPPAGNFETSKVFATNFEEERVKGNREKTGILKAARLLKLKDEQALK